MLQAKFVSLHDPLKTPDARAYFNLQPFATLVPRAGGWKQDQTTLWEACNEFTTRAELAFSVMEEELRNESYALISMSDKKRNVAYLWENTFRVIVPTLEELKQIYVREMGARVRPEPDSRTSTLTREPEGNDRVFVVKDLGMIGKGFTGWASVAWLLAK